MILAMIKRPVNMALAMMIIAIIDRQIEKSSQTSTESNSASSRHWYVSHKGSDDVSCGESMENSCHTLDHVMQNVIDGDVIHLDGSAPEELEPYSTCRSLPYDLNKSLTFVGENGRPVVTRCLLCHIDNVRPSWESVLKASARKPRELNVSYQNIHFVDVELRLPNSSWTLSGCTFTNSTIVTVNPCHHVQLSVTRSAWLGFQFLSSGGNHPKIKANRIECLDTNLSITKSRLSWFVVQSNQSAIVLVEDSEFANDPEGFQHLGGLHMSFNSSGSRVVVRNVLFQNQVHPSKVQSIINLYESALWLKSLMVAGSNESGTTATALIDNCRFIDNERSLAIVGPFEKFAIRNSVFIGNRAIHAGAAILVLANKSSPVVIDNCTFTNNMAGRYRDYYSIEESEDALKVIGDEVHLNTSCCKGVIMLVGKGGAIRIQRGNVTLSNSHFTNNTARLLGSSIFVDIDGTLEIWNTFFENSEKHDHALQGDVLFSDGHININMVKIVVRTAMNGLSIVRHSGKHWSFEMANVWIQCPVGYDLRTTNSSAYGVSPDGLRRSYHLDQLSYFCESCPRSKYSLDYGYLNYTMVFSNFIYFTLLINGSVPKAEYVGSYDHHEIQCKECPYGGQCVHGIRAVTNFWGFESNNSVVRFQHCPKGYCCSTSDCQSIDSCANLRYGRLCGKCQEGFSEAWFSTICVPNGGCGPLWLLPFSALLGLLYVAFLMFQTDLKRFIFAGPEIVCSSFVDAKKFSALKNSRHKRNKGDDKIVSSPSDTTKVNEYASSETVINPVQEQLNGEKEASNGEIHFRRRYHKRQSGRLQEPLRIRSVDSGCIVALVYYFQDALLLNVRTVHPTPESRLNFMSRSILSGLFKFELDVLELLHSTCAWPDMTPVPKLVSQALLVPYMLSIFGVIYLLTQGLRFLKGGTKNFGFNSSTNSLPQKKCSSYTRLVSGTLLTVLFMYQKIGTTTFTLLNCVPINNENVLFVDGTITCYQYWQYAVIAYATVCVTPFFIVLMTGPALLQSGRISLWQFMVACLCPLLFLILWTFRWVKERCSESGPPARRYHLSDGAKVAINILQGPFKENRFGLCWAGVLVGRRLVLILLFTFVNDTLLRLLGMLLVCSIILLHHVDVQPYKDTPGNIAGTVSAGALVTLSIINLVRAAFEAAEYHPTGPNAILMRIFTEIETTLIIWIPLLIVVLISLLCFVRVAVLLGRPFSRRDVVNRRQEAKDTRLQPW